MCKRHLGFIIACSILLGVFLLNHMLKSDTDGQAVAAPSPVKERAHWHKTLGTQADILLEMKGLDLRAVLGEPGLIRRDLSTVVWQYRNEGCVLDVYFTAAGDDESYALIAHYEIRARMKGVADEAVQDLCIGNLIKNKNTPRMAGVQRFYKALR